MLIILLHLLIIVLTQLSPFLFRWQIIVIFIGLYYLQLLILKNCILTLWQFKEPDRDTTFYWYLLDALGFQTNRRKLRIFVDYYLPWIILGIAIIWQVIFHHPALLAGF